jgi:peptidoglycan/xylan/chitin deacetylase (PgdA/CDA1 family)
VNFVRRLAALANRTVKRALRRRVDPHGLILTYHRIAERGSSDHWRLCVSPEHFAQQLDVLRRAATVVPLGELASALRTRRARPVVALTFDDGYVDNLTAALPLLQERGFPATVFVTTAYVGSGRPFWWDSLAGVILDGGSLPPSIQLREGHHSFVWNAHDDETSDPGLTKLGRQRLHLELWHWMYGMNPAAREQALSQLVQWSGRSFRGNTPARPMEATELQRLAACGLVEIGAHSDTHRALAGLSPREQLDEVARSREALKGILGCPPTSFAYPFGSHDAATRAALAETGYERACTTEDDLVWPGGHPMAMPRCTVGDLGAAGFRASLAMRWLP